MSATFKKKATTAAKKISAKKAATSKVKVVRSKKHGPSEESIRLHAYERYIERGYEHGNDLEDWFTAERELNAA